MQQNGHLIDDAIRDVVVPATELESQGHTILKLNIGDPIAYQGFQLLLTWSKHSLSFAQRKKWLLAFLWIA